MEGRKIKRNLKEELMQVVKTRREKKGEREKKNEKGKRGKEVIFVKLQRAFDAICTNVRR